MSDDPVGIRGGSEGEMAATSPNPDAYVKRIMASTGWSGSVVIEATENGASVFWRTEEQGKGREDYGPDAVGPTVLDALARAAADADALADSGTESKSSSSEDR